MYSQLAMPFMEILFYTTGSGREVVREALNALDNPLKAVIYEALVEIEKEGLRAAGVRFRHIEGKLWEIKILNQRILYTIAGPERMWLLHIYKKQGQRLPRKERYLALARMREVLS